MKSRKKENVDKKALAIFIKNPILGKAKTRIAKDSSDEKALTIYKNLLGITRDIAIATDCNRYVFYDQYIDEEDSWDKNDFSKKLQGGEDLGEKMFNAFTVLANENCNQTILIGSDCPYITPLILQKAFSALEDKDFVLGPTFDGGYYLIGMRKPSQVVFSDIVWSQETVFQNTLDRINNIGASYEILDKLNDIDHLSDWIEFTSKYN